MVLTAAHVHDRRPEAAGRLNLAALSGRPRPLLEALELAPCRDQVARDLRLDWYIQRASEVGQDPRYGCIPQLSELPTPTTYWPLQGLLTHTIAGSYGPIHRGEAAGEAATRRCRGKVGFMSTCPRAYRVQGRTLRVPHKYRTLLALNADCR